MLLSFPGRLKATQHLGFLLGVITWAPSAKHIPKFQTPRRKAGFQHKLHCWYSSALLSVVAMMGTFSKPKFPDASQRPTMQVGENKVGELSLMSEGYRQKSNWSG